MLLLLSGLKYNTGSQNFVLIDPFEIWLNVRCEGRPFVLVIYVTAIAFELIVIQVYLFGTSFALPRTCNLNLADFVTNFVRMLFIQLEANSFSWGTIHWIADINESLGITEVSQRNVHFFINESEKQMFLFRLCTDFTKPLLWEIRGMLFNLWIVSVFNHMASQDCRLKQPSFFSSEVAVQITWTTSFSSDHFFYPDVRKTTTFPCFSPQPFWAIWDLEVISFYIIFPLASKFSAPCPWHSFRPTGQQWS